MEKYDEKTLLLKGIEIYHPTEVCWMDYRITKNNPLTFHHIIPIREENGITIISNMAMLSRDAHDKFNEIERKNYIVAKQLNRLFKKLNASQKPPDDEYYEELYYYLNKYDQRQRIYKK